MNDNMRAFIFMFGWIGISAILCFSGSWLGVLWFLLGAAGLAISV